MHDANAIGHFTYRRQQFARYQLAAGDAVLDQPLQLRTQRHWQVAVEFLIMVAEERRPLMFADIAMRRALNHGKPSRPPSPRGKRTKEHIIVS